MVTRSTEPWKIFNVESYMARFLDLSPAVADVRVDLVYPQCMHADDRYSNKYYGGGHFGHKTSGQATGADRVLEGYVSVNYHGNH